MARKTCRVARSVLLVIGCTCDAHAATHDFAPLERYLAQQGLRASELAPLDVSYANGTAPAVSLYGANTELLTGSALLRREPSISWRAHHNRSYTIAFIDFGPDEGAAVQSSFFPFVHSLWTRCRRSLADCELTVKPYLPPGNPFVRPNRYSYLLLRHGRGATSLSLHGGDAALLAVKSQARKLRAACVGFSIKGLLRENAGLEVVALNFAHVHGQRTDSPKPSHRGRRVRVRSRKHR